MKIKNWKLKINNILGFTPPPERAVVLDRKKSARLVSGFTIVELLVSMTIFIVVIGIVVGIFVGSLRAERGLVSFMAINDNVSLALEQMTREFRTGDEFRLLTDGLAFTTFQGERAAYLLDEEGIKRGVCAGSPCAVASDFLQNAVLITGNKVRVVRLVFGLDPHEPPAGEVWPPRITVRIGVQAKDEENAFARTDIQTTLSARAQEP